MNKGVPPVPMHRALSAFLVALCVSLSQALADTGPPSGYTRVEQDDAAVSYSGGKWQTDNSSVYSGGTTARSAGSGSQATLTFSGTAVQWLGSTGPVAGLADVYLDGAHVVSVDAYSTATQTQVVQYATSGLAPGSHTLKIKVAGKHDAQSSGSWIGVDAFDILPASADTTPPSVSMTAPVNGATVSGTITVSANASDDIGVAGVQFQLDGLALDAEDTSLPYSVSWNTAGITDGVHTLTALARDAAGNRSTSAAVSVTVSNGSGSDTTPPSVSITSPTSGATVSGTITVSANASDNVGVAGVQFQLDGGALGTEDTISPYSIAWDSTTATDGSHTLTAVARDAAGNMRTSAPVSVTVSNLKIRIEQDDSSVIYVGLWLTASSSTVSGGTLVESNQAGASATLTFNGSGVSWIGYRCPCTAGIANVSVDGGSMTQVDNYTPDTEPQAVVFSVSNLPRGTHTLSIEITGQYDRAGDSAYVAIDAFDVTP